MEAKLAVKRIVVINPLDSGIYVLSPDELRVPCGGPIESWNVVGGPDRAVRLYGTARGGSACNFFGATVMRGASFHE